MIGLFFFIRASGKDRTQKVTLITRATEDQTLSYLKNYFEKRAYKVTNIDPENDKVYLEGLVSPSLSMAILLSSLAACGFFCLNLVLYFLYPNTNNWFLLLILLSPLAGFFYWRKAGRIEKIGIKLEAQNSQQNDQSIITIMAHRDELIELEKSFPFEYSTK